MAVLKNMWNWNMKKLLIKSGCTVKSLVFRCRMYCISKKKKIVCPLLNQNIIKVFHHWTKMELDGSCSYTSKSIVFVVRIKNLTPLKDNWFHMQEFILHFFMLRMTVEERLFLWTLFSDTEYVMLSGFDLQENYAAIPQDFSKIQNVIEFVYFLWGHN